MSQKVFLTDKVGAVPITAQKHPGEIPLEKQLNAEKEIPPDTLIITMSEKSNVSAKQMRGKSYSASCEDTASKPIKIKGNPVVDSSGLKWTIVLDEYSIIVGNCIKTAPEAEYIRFDNNSLGRGGVKVDGKDGTLYLYEVTSNPAVSGVGKPGKWIPPNGKKVETVPETHSTIKILSISPYTADIYIYDNQGQYVNHLTPKFGFKAEMEDPLRGNSSTCEKLGYLYWNQRTENDKKVGTGIKQHTKEKTSEEK